MTDRIVAETENLEDLFESNRVDTQVKAGVATAATQVKADDDLDFAFESHRTDTQVRATLAVAAVDELEIAFQANRIDLDVRAAVSAAPSAIDDLEAEFQAHRVDHLVTSASHEVKAHVSADDDLIYKNVGKLARTVHDSIKQISDTSDLPSIAADLPDARDRLQYIANMTENSANKVLDAIDVATPLQRASIKTMDELIAGWDKAFSGQLSAEEFKTLSESTRTGLRAVRANTSDTSDVLQQICLAQDFQDLTGQVVRKLSATLTSMEAQMIDILVAANHEAEGDSLMSGPVIHHTENTMKSQEDVDQLLAGLGF